MPLPFSIVTHKQRVCSLYKRAVRNLESWYDRRYIFRYHSRILRKRFDDNISIIDRTEMEKKLAEGEEELFKKQHYQPVKFPQSPKGCDFERTVIPPDWVLDYWHPLEKARYPDYFARREQRKKEYVQWWNNNYGKAKGGIK